MRSILIRDLPFDGSQIPTSLSPGSSDFCGKSKLNVPKVMTAETAKKVSLRSMVFYFIVNSSVKFNLKSRLPSQ